MTDALKKIKLVAMDVDGTFTDGTLYYDGDGKVTKGFSSHDGMGLELLRRAGIRRGFITGRHDYATEARASYLGADFYRSNVGDKETVLREVASQFDVTVDECMYVGDDLNDLPAFQVAGVAVATANAVPAIRDRVDFVTGARGGYGAIREVVERLLAAQGIDTVELFLSDRDRRVGMQ